MSFQLQYNEKSKFHAKLKNIPFNKTLLFGIQIDTTIKFHRRLSGNSLSRRQRPLSSAPDRPNVPLCLFWQFNHPIGPVPARLVPAAPPPIKVRKFWLCLDFEAK